MNPRVKNVQYESPYKLTLVFTNDEVKQFDLSPYLSYPVYEPLSDEAFCQKAKVFLGTVVWDDAIDFDPNTLFLEARPIVKE